MNRLTRGVHIGEDSPEGGVCMISGTYYSYEVLISHQSQVITLLQWCDDYLDLKELSYEYIVSIREAIVDCYGIVAYEKLIAHSIWNSKARLTFSDFCEFHDVRNSFHAYFMRNYIGDIYRSQSFYPGFAQRNPKFSEELLQIFGKGIVWEEITDSDKSRLYEAYLLMIEDPLVKSNQELFL